ncbi:MAG: hypothetical protein A2W98_03810 [Bacteroidetes bacterium GWF2_33_38]|nr:MAG: hypothetical protein A2W98_03810 [Bacteroidetes bacterium GWF2_33_38]OFY75718.1 MAG: hypothetical protein A2265_04475 [Bacteroidetes bacterium RIFOXYA12_FULL_33_9]
MKHVKIYVSILLATIALASNAQKIQWASKIVKVSSEYSNYEKSAKMLLGRPNVYPRVADAVTAWSVEEKKGVESTEPALVRVGFNDPMRIQQVAVVENFNPGSVDKITIFGVGGEKTVVYEKSPGATKEKSRIINVIFEATEFFVKEVEVSLKPGEVEGWNQIDAIGISDSKDSIKWSVNTIPTLDFTDKPENLGQEINSIYDELAPRITPDGKALYFTRKYHPDNTGGFKDEDDIWYSELKNQFGKWSPAVNVGAPLNNPLNNFVQAITPDGNTLLLGNVYNKDGSIMQGVSITNRTKEGWSFPEKQIIVDFYNLNKHANYYLSNDGMTLLMAIERKDSYGGLDIYVSFRKGENRWSKPENLGPTINTPLNDYSPFLAADGETMYYSTAGKSGYGEDDIFITSLLDSTWTNWKEPNNLGDGINTPGSDSKYTIPASGEYAYYNTTTNSLGKNDIFRIKLPSIIKPKPVVLVYGRAINERNGKPIEAKISYEDLETGQEIGIARTNPNTGEYKIVLPAGKKYGFMAIADGFYSVTSNLDLSELDEYMEIEKDLRLAPIEVGAVFTLNNIFFEFAKATLMPESFPELNRAVKFLFSNQTIEIEIGGHTDNVGSDITNQNLSEARAQAVADYLQKSGIAAARMTVVGYGETRPVAFNTDDEGRQMNRRVEFKIMKK